MIKALLPEKSYLSRINTIQVVIKGLEIILSYFLKNKPFLEDGKIAVHGLPAVVIHGLQAVAIHGLQAVAIHGLRAVDIHGLQAADWGKESKLRKNHIAKNFGND